MDWKPDCCALGIDFGSTSSKVTLAYVNQGGREEILRVPWQGDIADPEHPHTSRNAGSEFSFVASAALVPAGQEYGLLPGRRSLSQDLNFPLKTLMLWAAGVRRPLTMPDAPSGPQVLEAGRLGQISVGMVEEVLVKHLDLVYSMATAKTRRLGLSIVHVVHSYPNFLCSNEEREDFTRFIKLYQKLLRRVCGCEMPTSTISEGQATAIYVTEAFDDPLDTFNRGRFWDHLRGLNKSEAGGLPFLILDSGGSTTNVQLQYAFFDEGEKMISSQSVTRWHWPTGVQGGSDLANCAVRDLIQETLGPNLPAGELAALLRDFEAQKCEVDWTQVPLPTVTLRGNTPASKFTLYPCLLQPIFNNTFGRGLDCLEQMGREVLDVESDLAIVLCGGSYFCKGLRSKVEGITRRLRDAAESRGFKVQHSFLASYDTNWSSGVSAGAALSVLRMPYPADLLDNACIGIQLQWPLEGAREGLVGEDKAYFLLGKGCQELPTIKIHNDPTKPGPVDFTLICDPVYYRTPLDDRKGRAPWRGNKCSFKPIMIGKSGCKIPPYEQGFSVRLSDLPRGYVQIAMGGAHATALAKNASCLAQARTLVLELTAYRVDKAGRRMRNALDKRWLLRQETDGATKHVIVEDSVEVPAWCQICRRVTKGDVYQCLTCLDSHACARCFNDRPGQWSHNPAHRFKRLGAGVSFIDDFTI